jgi:hypothetical protein
MRLSLLTIAASWAVLFAPSTLRSQTASGPSPSSSPNEPRWRLSLGVKEDLQSRVQLSTATDDADLVSRLGGTLSYDVKGPRLLLALTGSGSGLFYRQLNHLNRFSYTGGVVGSYVATPKLTLSFAETLRSAYTYDTPALVEDGLFLPLVLSRTNRAQAGLAYQFSPRTALEIDGHHDWVKFDSSALVSGSRLSALSALRRQVSKSHNLGFVYGFHRYVNRDRVTYFNSVSPAWRGTLNRWLDASASVGAGWLDDTALPTGRVLMVGTVTLSAHFRHSTVALRARRDVTPAYGLGHNRESDSVSIDLSRNFGTKLTFLALASFSDSDDPFNSDTVIGILSQNHLASLSYAVSPDLSLTGGYTYRTRNSRGASSPGIHSHGAQLSLSYGLRW